MNATTDASSERLAQQTSALVKAVADLVDQLRDGDCDRLLNAKQVAGLLNISKPALHRLVSSGKFPQPVKPSPGRSCWRRSTVAQFISELD